MSSRRGGGRPFSKGNNGDSSSREKNVLEYLPKIEQLTQDVADGRSNGAKPWNPPAHKAVTWNGGGVGSGNPWQSQNANFKRTGCRGNRGPQLSASEFGSNNVTSNPLIQPPLEHGWNWQSRTVSMSVDDGLAKDEITEESPVRNDSVDDEGEEGLDAMEDTDMI